MLASRNGCLRVDQHSTVTNDLRVSLMAERINVRPEKGISLLDNQADARFSAFEKQADQTDCGEARFMVELLRKLIR